MQKILYAVSITIFIGLLSGSSCVNSVFGDSLDSEFVFFSLIVVKDGKLVSNQPWSRGSKAKDVKFPLPKDGTQIEVDILNCAGYLGSAKMTFDNTDGWQLQIIPETTAPDVVEKGKQCGLVPDTPIIAGTAFAITPRNEKRKNIKLKNPDLQKAFASLPWSVQRWAETLDSHSEKSLSLSSSDDWADTDGDGEIDLVQISGYCSSNNGYICSRVLRKSYDIWTEIAYKIPA